MCLFFVFFLHELQVCFFIALKTFSVIQTHCRLNTFHTYWKSDFVELQVFLWQWCNVNSFLYLRLYHFCTLLLHVLKTSCNEQNSYFSQKILLQSHILSFLPIIFQLLQYMTASLASRYIPYIRESIGMISFHQLLHDYNSHRPQLCLH